MLELKDRLRENDCNGQHGAESILGRRQRLSTA